MPAPLNIDTLLPEQAPLLAAQMADGASVGAVRQALLRRPADGYASAADFWAAPSLAGAAQGEAGPATGVTTGWFALAVTVQGDGPPVEERALIDATHLPARLVARQWGEAP